MSIDTIAQVPSSEYPSSDSMLSKIISSAVRTSTWNRLNVMDCRCRKFQTFLQLILIVFVLVGFKYEFLILEIE